MTPAPERPDQIIAAVKRYGIDSPSLPFELESILAAAPVTDAGLDETLLAMAIDRAWSSPDYDEDWLNTEGEPLSEVMAEQIAAEYDALSRQAEKETA